MPNANEVQYGGDHYKSLPVEPWDFITANGIGFLDGNAIKYLARWRQKGGVEDLRKARHYIDKLIEIEAGKEAMAEETPQRGNEMNEHRPTEIPDHGEWDFEDTVLTDRDQSESEPRFIPPTDVPASGDEYRLQDVMVWADAVGQIVLVEWDDAASDEAWQPYAQARDLRVSRVRSVGWLLAADANRLVMAAARVDDHGDVGNAWVIPSLAVVRIRVFAAQ